jgi:periplasmic protein TonB
MNTYALHEAPEQTALRRWGASAAAILAAHAAVIALGISWQRAVPAPGVSLPAIMVDMAPETTAPQAMPIDIAPGPLMQQADASPPEPAKREQVEEQIAPTPPQEKPEVVAPPEQKLQPTLDKPEPSKVVPEQKPTPVKPKAVRPEAKRPVEAPPAPRTSAPPRAEREAPLASAMSSGARASALASYNQRVRAALMSRHSYPAGGNGQRGTVTVSFTVGRGGQVLSSRMAGSSGVAAFDAAAMAMVRGGSFPPIPPEISYGSVPFTIPVRFGR